MTKKSIKTRMAAALIGVAATTAVLAGCGAGAGAGAGNVSSLTAYEISDMSGYGVDEIKDSNVFRSMTVKDMAKEMDNKNTFAIYFGFNNCPWCKRILPVLNDMAKKEGMEIGYMDTRKDPSWSSNLDIDDYDKFVEIAGSYLDTDSDGKKHLYVPHTFFIKNGEVVYSHEGVADNLEDPKGELSEDMKESIRNAVREGFDKMR